MYGTWRGDLGEERRGGGGGGDGRFCGLGGLVATLSLLSRIDLKNISRQSGSSSLAAQRKRACEQGREGPRANYLAHMVNSEAQRRTMTKLRGQPWHPGWAKHKPDKEMSANAKVCSFQVAIITIAIPSGTVVSFQIICSSKRPSCLVH